MQCCKKRNGGEDGGGGVGQEHTKTHLCVGVDSTERVIRERMSINFY